MPTTVRDPLDRMRYLIARCTAWRTWCGITTGTESEKLTAAHARTYARAMDVTDADLEYPYALITGTSNLGGERFGKGAGSFLRRFDIQVLFGDEFTGNHDVLSEQLTAISGLEANVDSVMADMHQLSGDGTSLEYDRFERMERPGVTPKDVEPSEVLLQYRFTGTVMGAESV